MTIERHVLEEERMTRQHFWSVVVVGLSTLGGGRAEAGLILTANAAGSEASTVSGVTTENFDSLKAGRYTSLTTAVGTLSSPGLEVVSANQYGGAGGGGNYFAIGAESGQTSATLTLNGPQAYFGFWWSAADPMNQVELLSGGKVVASFDPASALGALGSAYYGNSSGCDSGEKFAYLNFIGTGGTTFDQVEFLNSNTSTGFESDNWSVRSTPLNPNSYPGANLGNFPSVPEPSSLVLTASGVLAVVGFARRRRRT
jgi:hypothetical protein